MFQVQVQDEAILKQCVGMCLEYIWQVSRKLLFTATLSPRNIANYTLIDNYMPRNFCLYGWYQYTRKSHIQAKFVCTIT